jgi:hypothetical protein
MSARAFFRRDEESEGRTSLNPRFSNRAMIYRISPNKA